MAVAEALNMAEPHSPQCLCCQDREQHKHTLPQASPILPKYPYESHEQPTLPNPPMLPTYYQVAQRRPVSATWHVDDPYLFCVQERKYLSRPTTWLRIQIDIDLPDNPQAIGSRCSPPETLTSPQKPLLSPHNVSQPQHRLPSGHKMVQTASHLNPDHTHEILIDPLPTTAGSKHHRIRQHHGTRHCSTRYPYPPPELRHGLPGTINDDARWCHTPHSGRRRVERTSRRGDD